MRRVRLITALAIIAATCAQAQPLPDGLQKVTDCMLQVLKSTPGVSDPKIGTGNNGSLCLEYRPDEKSVWEGPTAFCIDTKNAKPPYQFLGNFPGLLSPGEKTDIHVSESVMNKWNAQCGVETNGVFT
jgi:hypothetical protein